MSNPDQCWGSVTEPGGMGFSRHRCSRRGIIRVKFVGRSPYFTSVLYRNKQDEKDEQEVRERTAGFCKSHYPKFRREFPTHEVLSGNAPPLEVPSRSFLFEFTARETVYAKTEEEAREKFHRQVVVRAIVVSTPTLVEVC